jgi:cytochrome c peroxidase
MKKLKTFIVILFIIPVLIFSERFIPNAQVSGQGSGTLATPTGVTASDNAYNNKVGIYWDTMKNATNYRVFRNTTNSPTGATEVGTSVTNFFFDATAPAGQAFFYFVRAENSTATSALSAGEQGTRAIGTQQGPVPPLEPPGPGPAGNPTTATKTALGKALFWDEQMSSTLTVSCGTCHRAGAGGSDPRSVTSVAASTNPGFDTTFSTADDVIGSPGVPLNNADGTYSFSTSYALRPQVTGRKSNSTINAVYAPLLFWDGRATGTFRDPVTNAIVLNAGGALESQASGPPVNAVEMGHGTTNWTEIAARLTAAKPLAVADNIPVSLQNWIDGRGYPELFQEAFGTPEVTPTRIALAIGAYERSLFSDQTPLDLANAGIQPLTAAEQRGRGIFTGPADCNVCHAGNLLTDNTFRNIGVRPVVEDQGRFVVTANQGDRGEFKVPSLRNVELRGTFMHTGKLTTIENVVAFYNRGGDFPNEPNVPGNLIQPLGLSAQQQADLAAFLRRPLTDDRVRNELPPFDRPHLYTESTRVPQIIGTGVAGSGGQIPQAIAIEPPLLGNQSFTVAMSNGLGNAQALLVIHDTDPGTGAPPATASFARVQVQLGGSGNGSGFGSVSLPIANDQSLLGRAFTGRWYVTDAGATGGRAVSQAFRFTIFGEAANVARAKHADFDGDGKTDLSIFRPSVSEWWYQKSSNNQVSAFQFGAPGDRIVPADYTGDGKTDIAVYRPSTGAWFVLRSEDNSFYSFPFGISTDVPAPGDFDNDGKADAAVFRQGTWYIQASAQGTLIRQFGQTGDVPQTGDYDGDGAADMAIFRPNGTSGAEWWINRSTSGVVAYQFGLAADRPVAQDYTGDGKTDVAFWRPADGNWFVLRSEDNSYFAAPFGQSTDSPAPGDYDGDGRADFGIFRGSAGTWFVNRTTQGVLIQGFGVNGDLPAPGAFVP